METRYQLRQRPEGDLSVAAPILLPMPRSIDSRVRPTFQERLLPTGYDPQKIEPHWQKAWDEAGLFVAGDAGDKPPFYALHMFPYPSGDIHMGHVEAFSLA